MHTIVVTFICWNVLPIPRCPCQPSHLPHKPLSTDTCVQARSDRASALSGNAKECTPRGDVQGFAEFHKLSQSPSRPWEKFGEKLPLQGVQAGVREVPMQLWGGDHHLPREPWGAQPHGCASPRAARGIVFGVMSPVAARLVPSHSGVSSASEWCSDGAVMVQMTVPWWCGDGAVMVHR